ncbi:MAG: hypothetical protein J3Q66DRAFT_328229 [Benniella sp.]|nr:MAG: hypothetical protein J3Q66DRAFT_328229 [Benniella sp.]
MGENAPQASAEQGETEKPKAKRNRPIEIEDNEGDNNTIGDGSSGSSGDSRSSGGSGSSSTLTATRQKKMKEEYHRNFNDFSEPSWVLPSGTNVDTVIYRHVHALRKESLLHSFVISRVQTVKDLFSNDDDKNAIAQELARKKKRSDGPVVDVETAFISSYLSTPLETQTALSRGWLTSDSTLDDPSKMSLYHSMMQIFMTYHQEGLKLSTSRSESWYITKLWAFLPTILMMSGRLDHQPGEITSDASALRKNADRDLESRKFQGRKLDGMISCTITNLELGAIEAAKIDTGLQGTKSLTDSRKLGKVMKDMHDRVAAKAREDIRNKLETFGLLISRNTVTLFTLRRLPGRHYQLVNGGSYTFPTTWDARGLGAKAIIDLLVRLTIFKSDIEDMADKVIEWTQPGVGGVETDVLVRTLTTPLPSPKAEKSSYL